MNSQPVTTTTLQILLVEDSPADVRLLAETLKEGGFPHQLNIARDGDEALAMLRREGVFTSTTRPDLILLDLNLPRKDGCELLREIRMDAQLSSIPVVVLTTSDSERDMGTCRDLRVNSYLVKPVRFDKYADVVRSIESLCMSLMAPRMNR